MSNFKKSKINRFITNIDPVYWVIVSLSLIFLIGASITFKYGFDRITSLSGQVASLEKDLASTTLALQGEINETESSLSDALKQEKQNVVAIKSELEKEIGNFGQEVGSISGAVNTLEKLSKTDPELLQKYSKVFFLNEHYEPPRVTQIPDAYEYDESRNHLVHASVYPYLERMLNDALQAGERIYVFSAFRSFNTQGALKGQYTVTYGEGTANQFSADQGYSEHQLGTTVDFITTGIGGTLEGFDSTSAYNWLLNNAHKYGFILSYPENNNFYVFEPWHWRFVGVELATDLKSSGKNFYDLSQREIDEYLVNIFE